MNAGSRQVIVLMLIACIIWIVWMLANAGIVGGR